MNGEWYSQTNTEKHRVPEGVVCWDGVLEQLIGIVSVSIALPYPAPWSAEKGPERKKESLPKPLF